MKERDVHILDIVNQERSCGGLLMDRRLTYPKHINDNQACELYGVTSRTTELDPGLDPELYTCRSSQGLGVTQRRKPRVFGDFGRLQRRAKLLPGQQTGSDLECDEESDVTQNSFKRLSDLVNDRLTPEMETDGRTHVRASKRKREVSLEDFANYRDPSSQTAHDPLSEDDSCSLDGIMTYPSVNDVFKTMADAQHSPGSRLRSQTYSSKQLCCCSPSICSATSLDTLKKVRSPDLVIGANCKQVQGQHVMHCSLQSNFDVVLYSPSPKLAKKFD